MKKLKKFLSASRLNVAVFVLAVCLVLLTAVSAARAAYNYIASTYGAEVQMLGIGVSLKENGQIISYRNYDRSKGPEEFYNGALIGNMLNNGKLELDHAYNEVLTVYNSGPIDEYVRVTIYRYWVDPNKKGSDGGPLKLTSLEPSFIDLNLLSGSNGWFVDPNSSAEHLVLYYQRLLHVGEDTPPFADILKISGEIYDAGTQNARGSYVIGGAGGNNPYNGKKFIIRIDVDAVQSHNAPDAIRSAWGVDMNQFGIGGD